MRLINTKTFKISEFYDTQIPKYAILSHTWKGGEEISFEDYLYAQNQDPPKWGWTHDKVEVEKIKAMSGYKKIENSCKQALDDGHLWIWIDTCCIKKTDSAELSEAINSMYRWYQDAQICYAYLVDVSESSAEECCKQKSEFRSSRWFTRGWTLQELIAPRYVVFFSGAWTRISDKHELGLTIQEITNVPASVIAEARHLTSGHIPVAQILSWASTRTTTRTEDIAYCLMGLFSINMPLLYGEGRNAFLRLQLEIMQRTSDLTFLAWQEVQSVPEAPNPHLNLWVPRRIETFAPDPKAFYFSGDAHGMHITPSQRDAGLSQAWFEIPRNLSVSNRGMSVSLPLISTLCPGFCFAVLPLVQHNRVLWMPLDELDHQYVRVRFPAVTLSVSNVSYTPKETEIILPIYGWDRHVATVVTMPRILDRENLSRSPISILLTFPNGFGNYRTVQKFPSHDEIGMSKTFLYLCIDEDAPDMAYGAIEFENHLEPNLDDAIGTRKSQLAVFFVVDLSNSDRRGPKRWACRDISWSQFGKYKLQSEPCNLELRARSMLLNMTDNNADEMALPTWEHQSSFRMESKEADRGVILLDDLVSDLPYSRSRDPEDSSEAKEKIIIAQIIFPA